MMKKFIPKKSQNLSEWYNQIVIAPTWPTTARPKAQ